MRFGRLGVLLAVIAGVVFADDASVRQSLEERIGEILERPAAQRAFWGVEAVWLDTGEPLYRLNADKLFTPASVAKLYATALALERLGPDYRYRTRVVSDSPLTADGTLPGDLRLVGGGDPNLSSRVFPFNQDAEFDEDRLAPMRQLAVQAFENGLRRIAGDVVGDDTRYVRQPYPAGWSLEDAVWDYGAPVSALVFNDARIDVLVRPGRPGGPAVFQIDPPVDHYRIINATRTLASRTVPRKLDAGPGEAPGTLEIWGDISARSPGRELSLAVDDPALFAARALRHELEVLGIEIEGSERAEHLDPKDVHDLRSGPIVSPRDPAAVLAERQSVALSEAIRALNKLSVNLHAEMLARETAVQRRGVGSAEAGIEEMRDFLREIGLSPWEFFLSDGSGLSRKNLVSPAGTVKLLRAMAASKNAEAYRASLAVAGRDGTLDWRFSRNGARGRVQAKTGTLSHVTGLAGYGTAASGRDFAFAVFVNNFGVSTSYVRNLVDRIVLAWVEAE